MINLKEELAGYKPALDINSIEEEIGDEDMQDIVDIILQNMKKNNE